MSVSAWECPRCGRMNAPFCPSCFCKKDDPQLQQYLKTDCKECLQDAYKIFSGQYPGEEAIQTCATGLHYTFHVKRIAQNAVPLCSICDKYHPPEESCVRF